MRELAKTPRGQGRERHREEGAPSPTRRPVAPAAQALLLAAGVLLVAGILACRASAPEATENGATPASEETEAAVAQEMATHGEEVVDGAAESGAQGIVLHGNPSRVAGIFENVCSTCHGTGGKGDGMMADYIDPRPRDLSDAAYMATRSDEQIYLAIRDGGTAVGLTDRMAAWKTTFDDQQIQDLALLVRSFSRQP